MKVIIFNEFVEVDREEFEGDDEMLPKDYEVFYADDVVLIIRVLLAQKL